MENKITGDFDYWIVKAPSGEIMLSTFKETKELSIRTLLEKLKRNKTELFYLDEIGYTIFRLQLIKHSVFERPEQIKE
jgi:hypothetical protein